MSRIVSAAANQHAPRVRKEEGRENVDLRVFLHYPGTPTPLVAARRVHEGKRDTRALISFRWKHAIHTPGRETPKQVCHALLSSFLYLAGEQLAEQGLTLGSCFRDVLARCV